MSLHIEIQDIHRKPLIDFYQKRLTEIDELVAGLKSEYQGIKDTLDKLEKIDLARNTPISFTMQKETVVERIGLNRIGNHFDIKGTWAQKIIYLMKREGRPLTTAEIANTIIGEFQPELKDEREKVVASLSSTLTNPAGRKIFNQSKNQYNQKAYSLLEK